MAFTRLLLRLAEVDRAAVMTFTLLRPVQADEDQRHVGIPRHLLGFASITAAGGIQFNSAPPPGPFCVYSTLIGVACARLPIASAPASAAAARPPSLSLPRPQTRPDERRRVHSGSPLCHPGTA